MPFRLTKREVDKLGSLFAERLLHNARADPAHLPGLTGSKDWKAAEPQEKKNALRDIAQKARATLLECGYSNDLVDKIVGKHIRN